MSNSSFDQNFWTRVLAEKDLESPGYHEAVADAQRISAEKKLKEQKPSTRKKKK